MPVQLADVNQYTKIVERDNKIVPTDFVWSSIYDDLKASVNQTDFVDGVLAKVRMRLPYEFRGQAWGAGANFPRGGTLGYKTMHVPCKRLIVPAEITMAALRADRSLLQETIEQQRADFKWLMEQVAFGDGYGTLAVADANTAVADTVNITFTCTNTYTSLGLENVQAIRVGQWVEVYLVDGTKVADEEGVCAWKVVDVSFGDRDNGAATTGTFTIQCLAGASHTAGQNAIYVESVTDTTGGTAIFIASSYSQAFKDTEMYFADPDTDGTSIQKCYEAKDMLTGDEKPCSLPIGLRGIVQDPTTHPFTDGTVNITLDTFQGLARTKYSTLRSRVVRAGDFGGTNGTPYDWSLGTISRVMTERHRTTGFYPDVLGCSQELAEALNAKNISSRAIQVTVQTTAATKQAVVGAEVPNMFRRPDGKLIPIKVWESCPKNVLYMLTTEHLEWNIKQAPGFDELDGAPWHKTYGDRLDNIESHYVCEQQLLAERCDTQTRIEDLRDDYV